MRLGFLMASLLAVTASLGLSQPSVEKIAHVGYVETVDRDGVKAPIDMVAIPGGTFVMGSPKDEAGRKDSEGPQHPVSVKAFWMAKHETTWAEYDLFWEKRPDEKKPVTDADKSADAITRPSKANHHDIDWGYGRGRKQPVVAVTHHGAMEFCRWLSAKTGKAYRLPTEAEWEWACRAGTTTPYSFGADAASLSEHAWFDKNSDDMPHLVGQKKPNPWGLFDMHGNVAEWCLDHYDEKFYGTRSLDKPSLNPFKTPTEKRYAHVARGGSWLDGADKCRSADRQFSIPSWTNKDPQLPKSIWWTNADWIGFRVVRAVDEHEPLKGLKSKITKESPN